MNKKSNEFKDENKEFVIRNMYPQRPWINYSWNKEYVSSFNQFGFGMSRFCDEGGYKKSILSEGDNRLIYIKDNKTKQYYAANRNYENAPFDVFETIVGMGYSVIKSEYMGISADMKIFVPIEGQCECWEVTIKNTYEHERDLSVYSYIDMDMRLSPIGYSEYSFSDEINGIYAYHNGFNLPENSIYAHREDSIFTIATDYTAAFFAASEKVSSYETTNRRFKGIYSDLAHPIAFEQDKLSSLDNCLELQTGCAMQFKIILKPGESKTLRFVLGAAKNLNNAQEVCGRTISQTAFKQNFDQMLELIDKFQSHIMVDTPDEEINRLSNIWLKRQMELGKQWGRLYGKGFRDIMQDTTGFLSLDPENARERIIYSAQYQRINGNPVRQWEPIMKQVYADGAVWLIYAVNAYLKETNDRGILYERIAYFDSEKQESLLRHCYRGFDYLFSNLGGHGLCLWLAGDWNDAMDGCGIMGRGESLWLSEAAVKAGRDLLEILDYIGDKSRYDEILKKTDQMSEAIIENGWNEDHFIYGFNDYGEKVGANECAEGKIFLNPQSWAVISGIVTGNKAVELMETVEKRLGCSYGYMQNSPSYGEKNDRIGRITYFEKGLFENGSVYNHGVAFKAVADCCVNNGGKALETIKRILPSNPELARSGAEPYVMSNMYIGPENPCRKCDAPEGWITGTSGWIFRCVTENILGIKAEYSGLSITPNMPDKWDKASISRRFRGADYNITIYNNKKTDKYKISVDGQRIDGNVLPVFDDNKLHNVICER